ncbi:hypothetical protein C8R44DRAFT_882531 [Mycena epipterygia]|nr:hypothetical protein C8R44DRAFT_882531 [Mycena epipterygia]
MTFFLSPKPRRILVIGDGPCGLVSLLNLVERDHFEEIVLAERKDDVGGVRYLENIPKSSTPRSRPFQSSPAYPGLIDNDTYAYLRKFAEPFLAGGQIRLSTEVVWVDELPGGQ